MKRQTTKWMGEVWVMPILCTLIYIESEAGPKINQYFNLVMRLEVDFISRHLSLLQNFEIKIVM